VLTAIDAVTHDDVRAVAAEILTRPKALAVVGPFDDPTTFDPARKNARQHISFGRGIHSCPGAPLARTETRVAIERLLDRTSDIRINERVHGPANDRRYQYVPTYILRGLTELHLELTPA